MQFNQPVKIFASSYGPTLQKTLPNKGNKIIKELFQKYLANFKFNGKITIESPTPGKVTNKIMQVDTTSEGTQKSAAEAYKI